MSDGIHVRAVAEYADESKTIARMTVQIWPLPSTVLQELNDYLREVTHEFLKQKKIASDSAPQDLTAKRMNG